MTYSLRSAMLLAAALTASSVAPAQVTPESEPLIANGSGVMPVPVVLQPLEASVKLTVPGTMVDPLQPEPAEP